MLHHLLAAAPAARAAEVCLHLKYHIAACQCETHANAVQPSTAAGKDIELEECTRAHNACVGTAYVSTACVSVSPRFPLAVLLLQPGQRAQHPPAARCRCSTTARHRRQLLHPPRSMGRPARHAGSDMRQEVWHLAKLVAIWHGLSEYAHVSRDDACCITTPARHHLQLGRCAHNGGDAGCHARLQ